MVEWPPLVEGIRVGPVRDAWDRPYRIGGVPGNRPGASGRFRLGPGVAVGKLDRMKRDPYLRGIAVWLGNEKAEARDEAGRAVFTAAETALHGR